MTFSLEILVKNLVLFCWFEKKTTLKTQKRLGSKLASNVCTELPTEMGLWTGRSVDRGEKKKQTEPNKGGLIMSLCRAARSMFTFIVSSKKEGSKLKSTIYEDAAGVYDYQPN